MPTYTNPKWVHVEPRSGFPVLAVIVLAVIGYAAYQVAEWVASILVAIEIGAGVVAAAAVTGAVFVLRRQRGRAHLDAPQWVVERLGVPRIQSCRPLPVRPAPAIVARPERAIEAPSVVHHHLHLHGRTPDAAAEIIRRQLLAAEDTQS
jgi:hypothetical protein